MNHHDSTGVWVVTELPTTESQSSDSLLFPDGFVWPASDRNFTPLFSEDNEPFPRRDVDWISHVMQGIKRMHLDEAARKEVADRLF